MTTTAAVVGDQSRVVAAITWSAACRYVLLRPTERARPAAQGRGGCTIGGMGRDERVHGHERDRLGTDVKEKESSAALSTSG